MSFREIGTILDKARKQKEASKEQTEKQSLSTQAYKPLFRRQDSNTGSHCIKHKTARSH